MQTKTGLEREENRNTWSLRERPQSAADKPSRIGVRRINVDRGFLVYRDTTIQTDKEIDVAGEIGAGALLTSLSAELFAVRKRALWGAYPEIPTPDTAVEMSATATLGDNNAAAGTIRAADVSGKSRAPA